MVPPVETPRTETKVKSGVRRLKLLADYSPEKDDKSIDLVACIVVRSLII